MDEKADALSAMLAMAEVAQREYEDSLTFYGRVADAEYLGRRVAVELVRAFPAIVEAVSAAIGAEGQHAGGGHEERAE